MSSITLTSAISSNLLALQNTQSLTDITQAHLATGLKVSSAIDNPVAYFQSQALTQRASDFQTSKDNIDQGISSLSTALQGITSIQTLVSQLKGLALSAQSASSTQIGSLVSQYNSLRSQVDTLAQDSSYQGLNLIAGSGQQLTTSFSNLTGSNLTVKSVDATSDQYGLNLAIAYTSNGGFQVGFSGVASGKVVGVGNEVNVVYSGTAQALTSGVYTFSYGTQALSIQVASQGGFSAGGLTTTATFTPGTVLSLIVGSASLSAASDGVVADQGNVTGTIPTQQGNAVAFDLAAQTAAAVSTASGIANVSVTLDGLTGNTLNAGTYTFQYGANTVSFYVDNAASPGTAPGGVGAFDSNTIVSNGQTLNFSLVLSGAAAPAGGGAATAPTVVFTGQNVAYASVYSSATTVVSASYISQATSNVVYAALSGSTSVTSAGTDISTATSAIQGQTFLDSNLLGAVNQLVNNLDTNLQTLRSYAQSLGTNVALLNTRSDFTQNYTNLLNQGAGKLTLADLNTEGANLLALQTRQQLGIQSLSFAGSNEKSILQLFR